MTEKPSPDEIRKAFADRMALIDSKVQQVRTQVIPSLNAMITDLQNDYKKLQKYQKVVRDSVLPFLEGIMTDVEEAKTLVDEMLDRTDAYTDAVDAVIRFKSRWEETVNYLESEVWKVSQPVEQRTDTAADSSKETQQSLPSSGTESQGSNATHSVGKGTVPETPK